VKKSRKRRKIELNLKKQSQFLKGQNEAKIVMTRIYGDFDGPVRRKNKANSKPIAGL